jgi:glutamate-ammonia-ligase adenylyltransferase
LPSSPDADFKNIQDRVCAASRFVADVCAQDPTRLAQWIKRRWFETPFKPGAMVRAVRAATRGAKTEAGQMRALRRTRNEQMARIAFRDLAGWAPLDETLAALSELADAALQAALGLSEKAVQQRHGKPRDETGAEARPFVLGMGKLGGRELNFSSDIDLIFGYSAAGETGGPRKISSEEYFEKLVQLVTRYLSERTGDGFVFRVDWLLRPFGKSGPPAMSSTAMEQYYQAHGREWERYALIKARVVAGDAAAGEALLKTLQPFVYRRYLDFNAVGNLRELKRLVEEEVARKSLEDNIKLGAGGIREIEFIVQSFQLMRGGQEAALRGNRLRPVLRYLGASGHLSAETAAALDEAYCFLRRLENALQMFRDEQTHTLPESDAGRAALCAALDFPDWDTLAGRIRAVRARVQKEFGRLFGGKSAKLPESGAAAAVKGVWNGASEAVGTVEPFLAAGFRADPAAVQEAVQSLRQSLLIRTLSESTLKGLETLVTLVLSEALEQAAPEVAAQRVLQVISAVAGRSTYLTLLRESETARGQLLRLCAASPWITDLIARSPILLDQLLDERTLYAPPEREQMRLELEELIGNVPAGDTEAAMNALRRFRQETMLRVAAAYCVHALPLVKVSDRLTWLAEVILEKTLSLVRRELVRQHGQPLRSDGKPAGLGVIAYGKFGGIEMGYGSDLDIVFLHDCDNLQGETVGAKHGGRKQLANEVWLSRLAQRVIHWISTQTSAGRAYEVDLELRPDGRRGLTVNSLASFESYQKGSAWTWEHQALSRARPVAGDAGIQQEFARIRHEVLAQPRDAGKLRREVLDMRERMRASLDQSTAGRFDVKQGKGGLTDIEFITQYLVLRHAHAHPELIKWSDHWRQTEALVAAGCLAPEQAEMLINAYREYRTFLHIQSLAMSEPVGGAAASSQARQRVQALWMQILQSQ